MMAVPDVLQYRYQGSLPNSIGAAPPLIADAVAADEPQVVALWRSCGLVASYNDPGQTFGSLERARVPMCLSAKGQKVASAEP
jgi:hypothetical protein